MNAIGNYLKNNKRLLFLLYIPVYMFWFTSLEKWTDRNWHILHCGLDDITPFMDLFIVPYYIWFAFVAFFVIWFYFKASKEDCVKLYSSLVLGMTLTLIIYTVWPNAIHLRPAEIKGNSIFASMVKKIWSIDTDTNVCPSLHVLNTLVIMVAIQKCEKFKGRLTAKILLSILSILICLSTVFLKQHSWLDVFAAFAMLIFLYLVVYVPDWTGKFRSKASSSN